MLRRLTAIVFILLSTSVAWAILGTTIFQRTYVTGTRLRSDVASTWGSEQEQKPPTATFLQLRPGSEKETMEVVLPIQSSRIDVSLALDHRKKGLLWYSTYAVKFAGVYTFRNPTDLEQRVTFRLPYPAEQAVYDDIVMDVDGQAQSFSSDKKGAAAPVNIGAGKLATLRVGYGSQGMDSWRYKLGDEVAQTREFQLAMKTNFKEIDFAPNTLSPTGKRATSNGWELEWKYRNLVSGFQISMTMPERLQPGPLAGQISYFAPVSLLLFFFLMFVITTMRNIELHPMNYFFLATAFFAFHLLLAYLVDVISIHVSFVLCSLVSIFLTVSYLRLVVGIRFAAIEAGIAQFIYLVLFSYAFFFKGLTGLTVTIGCIITLFVVMQMTGRIRWSEKFAQAA